MIEKRSLLAILTRTLERTVDALTAQQRQLALATLAARADADDLAPDDLIALGAVIAFLRVPGPRAEP